MDSTGRLFLALDQGGHSSRALVFNEQGNIVAQAQESVSTQRFPDSYKVEQDPLELSESLLRCCEQISARLGENTGRIQTAGLATQRSSILCWRKSSGKPVSPVLSWQDRRASELVASLNYHADNVQKITGLVLSPHYGASKLHWCLKHIDQVSQARAEGDLVIGPLSSYLARALTGSQQDLCDPANASRTQLWDARRRDWSSELCELFDVDPALLPASVPSRFEFGSILLGETQIPLQLVTGDQSAAIYFRGEPDRKTIYGNLGTGAFLQRPIGQQRQEVAGLLNSVVYQSEFGAEYVLEGTVNGAGSALTWLSKKLGREIRPILECGIVQISQDKAGENSEPPIFINSISGLGSPFWVPELESRFLGEAPEILQAVAVLESIAFLIAENIEAMRASGGRLDRLLLTGGLASSDYLCQCLADICDLKVERSSVREATAMGVVQLLSNSQIKFDANVNKFHQCGNPSLKRRFASWQGQMSEAIARLN